MKKINLFEIEEKGEYWYLYPSNYKRGIITDRTELIDLSVNILRFTGATKQEIKEVEERIKESLKNDNL